VLIENGLIAMTPDRKGFMPAVDLPAFENQRYDLKKFIPLVNGVSSDYEVDEIKYDPKDVLKLLELFFAGKGEIKEVIYLSYYTCKYVDDRGMSRSKALLAPKYTL
jgi:hypothetical protein